MRVYRTRRKQIKQLYLEGFSKVELAIMHNVPETYVTKLVRGLKRNEEVSS